MNLVHLSFGFVLESQIHISEVCRPVVPCTVPGFKKNWHCFTTIGWQKKTVFLTNLLVGHALPRENPRVSIKFIHNQPPVSMSIMYFYHIQGDIVGGYLQIPQQGVATTLLSPFRCHTRHVYTSILASRCPV